MIVRRHDQCLGSQDLWALGAADDADRPEPQHEWHEERAKEEEDDRGGALPGLRETDRGGGEAGGDQRAEPLPGGAAASYADASFFFSSV
jgi:hypothetical protein